MLFSDDHFKKDKHIWYRSSGGSGPSEKWGAGNPDPEISRDKQGTRSPKNYKGRGGPPGPLP